MADDDDIDDEQEVKDDAPPKYVGVAPMAPSRTFIEEKFGVEDGYMFSSSYSQRIDGNFCGLSNQGATCYLNALIQCLYMTPEFRHQIFEWIYRAPNETRENKEYSYLFDNSVNESDKSDNQPINDNKNDKNKNDKTTSNDETKNDENNIVDQFDPPPEHCMCFQLQCLFARLRNSKRGAVSTKPLTKSFHWDDAESFRV